MVVSLVVLNTANSSLKLEPLFFWRVSRPLVSRRQEYRADELACFVAGSSNLIERFQSVHRASVAIPAYWAEVGRILNAGYRPPIAEGFARFLAASNIKEALATRLAKELEEPHTTPFDSHPPLRDRLAAAGALPQAEQAGGDLPAISLIEDMSSLEVHVLEILNPNGETRV